MNFTQLLEEHSEIDGLCVQIESSIELQGEADDQAFPLVEKLARALDAHLSHEDAFIYQMIMADRADLREAASDFVLEFSVLRRDWSAYLARWNAESIVTEWDRFRGDSADLIRRLRQRVRQEDALLYPLALESGCISLR